MIPAINETNKTLPFPGDINATVDFLFTCFNNNGERKEGIFSKKIIKDWLLDFLHMNASSDKQIIVETVREKMDAVFCWDYDDVSDLHLK